MRIVLDLQACQSSSRFRGIGRYSMALSQALARVASNHEIFLVMNGALPESIDAVRAAFSGLVDSRNIRCFDISLPTREIDPRNSVNARIGEKLREAFIEQLRPDIVHVNSLFEGLIDDVVVSVGQFEQKSPVSVTTYDLIPLLRQETYLADETIRKYYFRKVQSLKRADLLLGISEYSRQESIDYLQISPERVVNISSAVSPDFRKISISADEKASLFAKLGISKPYFLYSGAADSRKNIMGLLEAFAKLPPRYRSEYQLVLAGDISHGERDQIIKHAKTQRMFDSLLFTGYVKNEDLIALYNLCTLFVFPSFHEGFGLPALEAMACGAPVIGSNATSIPEVIGRSDALFDPARADDIAAKMVHVLSDRKFRQSLIESGLERAKMFSWEASAQTLLDAFSALHERTSTVNHRSLVGGLPSRPKLAYVSPLPPEKTGIADYSAELLPELTRHYDIDVIVEQSKVDNPWIASNFNIRDYDWLRRKGDRYDRVLYHVGNSPFHSNMLELMLVRPGVVVLHDFFLSSLAYWREHTQGLRNKFSHALYKTNGYASLKAFSENGPQAATIAYPANIEVFEAAAGVIVHSEHARELATNLYGHEVCGQMAVVSQLRAQPVVNRQAARQRLGLGDEKFVICSFGMIAPTKLNDRILSAFLESEANKSRDVQLVFVGENHGGDYGDAIKKIIQKNGAHDRVVVTGFVEQRTYEDYLNAADMAIQLRSQSRGETSRSALDALAYGLPLIVNSHGSMAEIPNHAVMKLDDLFSDGDLGAAIDRIWSEEGYRETLSHAGRSYLGEAHAAEAVASQYHNAIEKFAGSTSISRRNRLIEEVAENFRQNEKSDDDFIQIANSITANVSTMRSKEFFIDVSAIIRSDLKTGIQRVVRALLLEFLLTPPNGYRVEPVYLCQEHGAWVYKYARDYTFELLRIKNPELLDEIVEPCHGDILLSPDWFAEGVVDASTQGLYKRWRTRGVELHFVVHDLLPILMPHVFPDGAAHAHSKWLNTIADEADGLIAVSRSVADELTEWLHFKSSNRLTPLRIGYFHHGANYDASAPSLGLPSDSGDVFAQLAVRETFLMVGTIEPRKGLLQVLDAFELLWNSGSDVNLVIVGHEGWKHLPADQRAYIASFVSRTRGHAELNRRLFWLEGISDEYLDCIYKKSNALISASVGEGFGIPLIEAAHHKLPIICRDIPVFREVASDFAFYFSGDAPSDLAKAVLEWIELNKADNAPSSDAMSWQTWADSSDQILRIVMGGDWYSSWLPDGVTRFFGSDARLFTSCGTRDGLTMKSAGIAGHLIFGPYMRMKAGTYKLRVYGEADAAGSHGATFELSADGGDNTFIQVPFGEGTDGKLISTTASIENDADNVEIRVWISDKSKIQISKIEIETTST